MLLDLAQYVLPSDLRLALKIGLVAGLVIVGLGVTVYVVLPRKYTGSAVLFVACGGVVTVLSAAPWVSITGDGALAIAVAFMGAFAIGLMTFMHLWENRQPANR